MFLMKTSKSANNSYIFYISYKINPLYFGGIKNRLSKVLIFGQQYQNKTKQNVSKRYVHF